MTTETNKVLIARLIEAVNRADFAPLEPHPGFHETRKYVPPMHSIFTDWRTTHWQQIAEGDLVCTYCALELTQIGPFAGIAPLGKRVALEVLSLDRVHDGLVVEHNSASTWSDVLRQLNAPAFRAWPARLPRLLTQLQAIRPETLLRHNKGVAVKLLDDLSQGEFADACEIPGLSDLVDRFVELHRAFPDLTLTPVVQLGEGELVATRATLRGTHLGSLYGLPATGRSISWDVFCLARVEDGAVVDQQSLFDWNGALAQLGLLAM
jgi:predicted ester cyclase